MSALSPAMHVLVVLCSAALAALLLGVVVRAVCAWLDGREEPRPELHAVGTRASYRRIARSVLGESAVLFDEDFKAFRLRLTVVVPWWRACVARRRKHALLRALKRNTPACLVLSTRFVVTFSMARWRAREKRS